MKTAEEMRAAYEAGATIEELALETGHATNTIRKRLHDAGTVMRPPGMKPKGQNRNQANAAAPKGTPGTGVHRARSLNRRRAQGKRGRSSL
jgi:predicted transcriptional regulator